MGLYLTTPKESVQLTRSRQFHFSQLLKFCDVSHDVQLVNKLFLKCHPFTQEEHFQVITSLVNAYKHELLSDFLQNTLYIPYSNYDHFITLRNHLTHQHGDKNPLVLVFDNYLRTLTYNDII